MTKEQQILIDRMVDGELDDQQQRELLLSCERRQAWRELALAYIESQAMASELNLLMEETTTQPSATNVVQPNNARPHSSWSPLNLAAAILLSLGAGYGLGWIVPDAPTTLQNETVTRHGDSATQGGKTGLSSMAFTVHDPATNGLRQVDLPILKASDLGPNWLQQLKTDLPEDYVRELRGRGLDITRTRTFTAVDLGDGRRVVVPIDYYTEQSFQ